MRTAILTAGIAGVLAIGGTGAAFAATGGSDNTATGVRATAVQPAATSRIISHARANQIAHQRVPGARITSGELKQRRTVWEINLLKARVRYEVDISARTGKVLRVDRDRHSDQHGGRSRVEQASAPRPITVRDDNPARRLDDNHRHGGRPGTDDRDGNSGRH
ncbi:MAG TPA: PepSY domain-containing protein [Mycobacteriales bacterium]|jgi:hypothetical protein|nr:PepSY domain-containing protein [Mycobacteriales bacterium]